MKKTLIVTYYWPPAGGPGVQRWLKFVKYLPEFNIEPIVFVPENPNYPIIDESLVKEVPESLKLLMLPISEPHKVANLISKDAAQTISKGIIPKQKNQSLIQRMLIYVRGNFFIPDTRKNWVKPSVKYLSQIISQQDIDTVITTGPPHSLHLIGMQLKADLNVRWIADFRDPWTTIGYHSKLKLNAASRQKHKQLEQKVLQSADQVIVTSQVTANEFNEITTKPVSVITNGYDHEISGSPQLDSKFSISHIGTLLSERNPEELWKVLRDLSKENNTFRSMLQINLIGSVSQEVLFSLESFGLTEFLNLKGYVSHSAAISYQRSSQVLLLVEIDSEATRCIIPGKLFEYLVSGRPILAIGPENSDVETIISETNTGHYFKHSDYRPLKETILKHFEAFRKQDLKSHPVGLQQYHRKALTKKLAELILN